MRRLRGADERICIDEQEAVGPAFYLLEQAEVFCQRHFPLAGKIHPDKFQHVETPLIPPHAIVELTAFDDCVEVRSPDRLPRGMSADDLLRLHASVPRNPTLAEVFYQVGLVDKWGRGVVRVVEMCVAHGLRSPEFAERWVVVTFWARVEVTT
jgi:ATP-dependent DNA helicase RecG